MAENYVQYLTDMDEVGVVEANTLRIAKSVSCPAVIKCNGRVDKPSSLTKDDLLKLVKEDVVDANEPVNSYTMGGYIPLVLGEQIGPGANYTVIKKLGYGTFSTVWFCHTQRQKQNCAVKISKASEKHLQHAKNEISILRYIKNVNPNHPGYEKLVQMLECFNTNSIYGNHICISMELLGPSLADLINLTELRGFESDTVKNIIKQVLLGLLYLHDVCSVIHTDLKPENILVVPNSSYATNILKKIERFNSCSIHVPKSYVCSSNLVHDKEKPDLFDISELFDFSSYVREKTVSLDKYRIAKVGKAKAMKLSSEEELRRPALINPNLQIKIGDLGNGVREIDCHNRGIQTREYRALEVLVGEIFSCSADVWSVACIAYELVIGQKLFIPEQTELYTFDEHHLSLITKIIGPIPIEVALSGRKSFDLFQSDGKLRCSSLITSSVIDLKGFFMSHLKWNEEEATLFNEFLLMLLEPDQTVRVTAEEALQVAWLNN